MAADEQQPFGATLASPSQSRLKPAKTPFIVAGTAEDRGR